MGGETAGQAERWLRLCRRVSGPPKRDPLRRGFWETQRCPAPIPSAPPLCSSRSLLCVAPFSKGFLAGGENGIVRVYEKSEDAKEMYRKAAGS